MARWIHEFRSMGERALTEEERLALRRRTVSLAFRRWSFGALAVVAFSGVFVGIAVAAGGNPFAWGGAAASLVAGCYLLSWASGAERLALLHRRALRVGTVEEFRRVRGDDTVRRLWQRTGTTVGDPKDEDDDETAYLGPYWSVDEGFEENLKRACGREPAGFTALGRDGAVLWVEGRPIQKILEPAVWEVVDPTHL